MRSFISSSSPLSLCSCLYSLYSSLSPCASLAPCPSPSSRFLSPSLAPCLFPSPRLFVCLERPFFVSSPPPTPLLLLFHLVCSGGRPHVHDRDPLPHVYGLFCPSSPASRCHCRPRHRSFVWLASCQRVCPSYPSLSFSFPHFVLSSSSSSCVWCLNLEEQRK